ncbi:thioredoxin-like protein [Umboniibacter marinipuniceus]|uniref:Thioredoxin-like protein n=2 Tax=Umboniibacter marinipuniceus TaxID=569599 RepID=A0A3M0A4J4_9GAMM|nr:thioredoxin-like protein [Umboniibacter marinipuniceus]
MQLKFVFFTMIFSILVGCMGSVQAASSKSMVVGPISAEQLLANHHHFSERYEAVGQVELTPAEIETLNEMEFIVLFGSWCHDSVREVPYFIRIMEAAGITEYQLIGVDYSKQDDAGLAAEYGLKSTPTFVVLNAEGGEVGRFVESNPKSMEDVFLGFGDS